MTLNKNVAIPLVLILLAAAGGGGYYLWQQKQPAKGAQAKKEEAKVQYTCAMHPFIIKDSPGTCPICGMALIKKVEGAQASSEELAKLGQVSLSPTQSVMANVATTVAKVQPLVKEVNAVGIIQYDQSRQAKVTAWVAGRIDKLNINTVGAFVSKGKPVAEVYSPDLVSAQQEYLLALKSREQFRNSPIQSIANGGEGLVSSAKQRLKLMGVTDEQIAGLEKGGQPNIRIPIYTPLSGVVIEKMAQEGQYVEAGMPLFSIADLSQVWAELELYENEFANIRIGQPVSIMSQSYPGQTFRGKVTFIYPFLDPKTRTVKVRVELANPGLKLKPDMFVNATVKIPLASGVVVPVTAVMDTGRRQVVWVESQPGMFEPRDIKVGAREGDLVQILSGVNAGEKVASSGGYLIDSEAQLKGTGGHEGHGAAPGAKPAEPGAPGPAGSTPKKGGAMNMDDMKM